MHLRYLPEAAKEPLCMEIVEGGTAAHLEHLGGGLGETISGPALNDSKNILKVFKSKQCFRIVLDV